MHNSLKGYRSNCPINYCLELLGDKWTLLIIRDMIFRGKRLYSEFLQSPERIASNILADRLSRLEEGELIEKFPDPDRKNKHIYRLRDKGKALLPVLFEMIIWASAAHPDSEAPPEMMTRVLEDRQNYQRELLEGLQ